jgi:DNA-binding NtrC family response regulator
MKSILVATSEQKLFHTIRSCFPSGYRVDCAPTKHRTVELLPKRRYDLIFIDLDILIEEVPDENYKEAMQPFWQIYPTIQIIIMAPHNQIRKAIKAVKAGASDYLPLPADPEEVTHVADSIAESIMIQSQLDYLRDHFWDGDALELVQTKNPAMKKTFDKIRSVAPTKSTVLLAGDTGTGKSVLAKLIHQHSNRREAQEPFFWMRSVRLRLQPRSNYCRFCRMEPFNAWAVKKPLKRMCG